MGEPSDVVVKMFDCGRLVGLQLSLLFVLLMTLLDDQPQAAAQAAQQQPHNAQTEHKCSSSPRISPSGS